jgi:hypothetical protein
MDVEKRPVTTGDTGDNDRTHESEERLLNG